MQALRSRQFWTSRWHNYWFSRNGIFGVEIARITLALIYIYTWYRYDVGTAENIYAAHSASLYDPKSLLVFFGKELPSTELLNTMILFAKVSPVFMLLGLFSKWSSWLVLISNLLVRAMGESFFVVWSHGFNVIFLAHIAFVFAPVGQVWSLDAAIRKLRGKAIMLRNGFWSLLLAQWAVALMFFMAFYWKVLAKSQVLAFKWASTDTMRNHIIDRYIGCGEPIPDYLEWMVNNPWAYKSLAAGNLIFQFLPLVACFLIRRPVLRLLFGFAFVIEEVGLAIVMQLPDYQWLPLIVFFVDWDYWLNYAKKITPLPSVPVGRSAVLISAFVLTFLGTYAWFGFNLSEKFTGETVFTLKAYPFSQFRMYSTVKRGENGEPYKNIAVRFEVAGEIPEALRTRMQDKLQRKFYNAHVYESEEDLIGLMQQLEAYLNSAYNHPKVTEIRAYRVVGEYVPPPEPAQIRVVQRGIMAAYDLQTGKVATMRMQTNEAATQFTFVSEGNPVPAEKVTIKGGWSDASEQKHLSHVSSIRSTDLFEGKNLIFAQYKGFEFMFWVRR